MSNKVNLDKAKKAKNDEFYTRLEDIEFELNHYTEFFKDKIIYCPCDSPESNFVKYFKSNFKAFGLKKLIATSYSSRGRGKLLKIAPNEQISELSGNGDFRSEEVKQYWEEADIIITNPPFSLFRDFFKLCKDKKYIFIANNLICSEKLVFPEFKADRIRLGFDRKDKFFIRPDKSIKEIKARWYTNLPIDPDIRFNNFCKVNFLFEDFNFNYKRFDNHPDIINTDKVSSIPDNYFGLIAVPVSFIDYFNRKQFDIIDILDDTIDGKHKFARYIIKRKQNEER